MWEAGARIAPQGRGGNQSLYGCVPHSPPRRRTPAQRPPTGHRDRARAARRALPVLSQAMPVNLATASWPRGERSHAEAQGARRGCFGVAGAKRSVPRGGGDLLSTNGTNNTNVAARRVRAAERNAPGRTVRYVITPRTLRTYKRHDEFSLSFREIAPG